MLALRFGSFRKLGVPYLGVRIIGILLFRVLYQGPQFSESFKAFRIKFSGFRDPKHHKTSSTPTTTSCTTLPLQGLQDLVAEFISPTKYTLSVL